MGRQTLWTCDHCGTEKAGNLPLDWAGCILHVTQRWHGSYPFPNTDESKEWLLCTACSHVFSDNIRLMRDAPGTKLDKAPTPTP